MSRLLIVDDEPDLLEALVVRFERAGFEVRTAPDGAAGLALARSWGPDVVLLDVAMPGMSGWDVSRALKTDARTRGQRVLVMTAAVLRGAEEAAREAKADGLVKKPFDDRALVGAVQELAARPSAI